MTSEMKQKAQELYDFCYKSGMPIGKMFVGVGRDKLHVYVHDPVEAWPNFIPEATIWCGTPIEWHWDVGPARAFGSPGV